MSIDTVAAADPATETGIASQVSENKRDAGISLVNDEADTPLEAAITADYTELCWICRKKF